MTPEPSYLTLAQVADELRLSYVQVYRLVPRGELRALKIGGRGSWRIARGDLEAITAAASPDRGRRNQT